MSLTPAQNAILKADYLTRPGVLPQIALGNWQNVAGIYNALSITQLWLPSITIATLNAVIDWAKYAAFSIQLQDTYLAMTQGGVVDATSPTVRSGFSTIFASDPATVTNLSNAAQRLGTVFEVLFSAGNVSTLLGHSLTASEALAANA